MKVLIFLHILHLQIRVYFVTHYHMIFLKRDGFRCVLCGRSAADGVKLHVDHIKPIAKGGKTVEFNLRTLCEHCNWGKSDKFDSDGVN